MMSRSHS